MRVTEELHTHCHSQIGLCLIFFHHLNPTMNSTEQERYGRQQTASLDLKRQPNGIAHTLEKGKCDWHSNVFVPNIWGVSVFDSLLEVSVLHYVSVTFYQFQSVIRFSITNKRKRVHILHLFVEHYLEKNHQAHRRLGRGSSGKLWRLSFLTQESDQVMECHCSC